MTIKVRFKANSEDLKEGIESYSFTDRFPKPEWFEGDKKGNISE